MKILGFVLGVLFPAICYGGPTWMSDAQQSPSIQLLLHGHLPLTSSSFTATGDGFAGPGTGLSGTASALSIGGMCGSVPPSGVDLSTVSIALGNISGGVGVHGTWNIGITGNATSASTVPASGIVGGIPASQVDLSTVTAALNIIGVSTKALNISISSMNAVVSDLSASTAVISIVLDGLSVEVSTTEVVLEALSLVVASSTNTIFSLGQSTGILSSSTSALASTQYTMGQSTYSLSSATASIASVVFTLGQSTATLSFSTAALAAVQYSMGQSTAALSGSTASLASVQYAMGQSTFTLSNSTASLASSLSGKASLSGVNTYASSQTITGAGGLLVSGDSVTASAFFGDGSHLTGIPSTSSISGSYVPLAGGVMTGALTVTGTSITANSFFGDASHLTGVAGADTVPASGVQSGWLGSGVRFSTANLASGVWQPAQLSTLLHGMTLDGTTLVSTITFTPSGANGTEPYSIQAVDGGGQDIALLSYASPWQAQVQPNGFGGLNPPMLLMSPQNLAFDELVSTTSDIGMGALFFSPVDPELGAGTQYVQGISYVHSAAGNSWMNGGSLGFYDVWATTTTEFANIQLIAATVDGSTYTAFSVVTDPFYGATAGLGTSVGGVWTPFSVDALIASGDIQLGGNINMQPGQGIWGGPTIDSVTVQNLATMQGGAIISGSLDGDPDGDSLDVINGLEDKVLSIQASTGFIGISSNTPNFPLDVQSIDGGSGIGVNSLGYIAQGPSPVIVYMCTDPGEVDDGQLFLGNGNTLACTAGSWTAVGIQLTAYPSH